MIFEHWRNDNDRGKLIWSKAPLIRIKWDGEPSGYEGNPDNWIFR
jgi:hypothetical protein